MTENRGDLSVTALYTSATWKWGGLPNAELFDHAQARRVFRVVNAVLGIARPFIGLKSPLPLALLHRHTLIDVLLRASGSQRVLELASGLSRRGVTFSSILASTTRVDRPDMVATKRSSWSERTLVRRRSVVNFRLLSADVGWRRSCALRARRRALFVIAEGLLMYLDADAQRRLWSGRRATHAPPSGTFVFDYVPLRAAPAGRVGRVSVGHEAMDRRARFRTRRTHA
jgi:O-methyltransferase involved in polyketide biosynthesis